MKHRILFSINTKDLIYNYMCKYSHLTFNEIEELFDQAERHLKRMNNARKKEDEKLYEKG